MSSRKGLEKKNNFGNGGVSSHYDPDKILEKVNNHRKPQTPNFDLMTSRPKDDGVLPSYMKNIFTRQSSNIITDKTLKMNNFANAEFAKTTDSFWPKKSHNKIINLNLLNSEKFIENLVNKKNEKPEQNSLTQYVDKSLKFYNKNFEDLLKESMLTKFDGVTYKSIKRKSKLNNLDNFIMNYENVMN